MIGQYSTSAVVDGANILLTGGSVIIVFANITVLFIFSWNFNISCNVSDSIIDIFNVIYIIKARFESSNL